MTNYNTTDKIIKSKYEAVDPTFDMESMWSDLAPQIEKKRRRGFAFWMLSGLVVVSLLAVGYFVLSDENNQAKMISIDSMEGEILAENKERKSTSLDQITIKHEEKKLAKTSNQELDKDDSILELNETERSKLVHNSVAAVKAVDQINEEVENLSNATNLQRVSELIFDHEPNDDLDNYSPLVVTTLNRLYSANKLISSNERTVQELPSSNVFDSYTVEPLVKNNWRIGINAGYYIHSRSFSSNSNDPSQNFVNRSSEESAKDGYDLGLRLEYFLSDHLVIIGGVRYSKAYVQRSADYTYTKSIALKDHVVKIINTEEGPIETVEDVTYDGVFTHIADNYITATRVGLISGLQYRIGADRWTTHIDAGVELPVWSSHNGIITHEGRPYSLSAEDVEINKTSIQVFGGLGVEYALSPVTALQATIGGYMPLNNEHVASYAIEKKSSLLGLSLGVNFRL